MLLNSLVFPMSKWSNNKTSLILFTLWIIILLLIASRIHYFDIEQSHQTSNIRIQPKYNDNNNNIDRNPGFPAFVVIGPPKSGTTSLVHTLTSRLDNFHLYPPDNGEHHFWNGGNAYTCLPDYGRKEWMEYIDAWNHNEVTLKFLNHTIWTSRLKHPRECTTNKYRSIWQWILCHELSNVTDKICKVSQKYHEQKFCDKALDIDHNLEYCYFVESAPSYIRNPLIGIMYAMNMPKTKLLGIIRNPVNMLWSWAWHYYSHLFEKTDKGKIKMEKWLLNTKMYAYPQVFKAFKQLTKECKIINTASNEMDVDYQTRFKLFYRKLMGLYLRLKFVDKMIEPHVRREPDAMLFSALIFPTFLFWIHAFDEIYGQNEWNNLRFVQFEWLYSNQMESFNIIHCWIKYGHYDCKHRKDVTFSKVLKKEAKAYGVYTDYFKHEVQKMYVDCNHELHKVLVLDRPNLLIGEWMNWQY